MLVSVVAYASDSTEPRLVKDVNQRPLPWPNHSLCGEPVPVNGVAFFCGANNELWMTDGTARGTQPVRLSDGSVVPGPGGMLTEIPARRAVSAGGLFYFLWSDELWRTDGTPQGTQTVVDEQAVASLNQR